MSTLPGLDRLCKDLTQTNPKARPSAAEAVALFKHVLSCVEFDPCLVPTIDDSSSASSSVAVGS